MKLLIAIPILLFSSIWMRDCFQDEIVGSDEVQVIKNVKGTVYFLFIFMFSLSWMF